MRDYDIYLFDWDGTLSHSTQIWLDVIQEEFAAHGVSVSHEQILPAMGDFHRLLDLGISEENLPSLKATIRARAQERLPEAPLFPGVPEMLTELKRSGKKLAVVTAMHGPIIESMMAYHKYHDIFDVIISGSDVKHQKPHPEGLLLAMGQLKRQPGHSVLMLGDTERDILAAQAAGVDSLLFYPPEHQTLHSLDELRGHKPTHVITNWQEFVS